MKHAKTIFTIVSFLFMKAAMAQEIVRDRYVESVDFFSAKIECKGINHKTYLGVFAGNISLWANNGLPTTERDCYETKFRLEDFFKVNPRHNVQVIEVEITRQECDRKRNCYPVNSAFQARTSLKVSGLSLNGYKQKNFELSPEPGEEKRSRRREGCEYQGKLGGGWWCP